MCGFMPPYAMRSCMVRLSMKRYDHGGLSWPQVGWSIERTDSTLMIFEGFGESESSEGRIGWTRREPDGEYVALSSFFADSINFTWGLLKKSPSRLEHRGVSGAAEGIG